jgi:hypothetical protein
MRGHLGHHVAFYGQTFMGKSHLAKQRLVGFERVLAVDVNDEYSQFGRQAGPLRERVTATKLSQHGDKLLEPHLSLAVVPDKPTPQARAALLKMVWKMLEEISEQRRSQPLVLVLDELGEYVEHCIAVARSLSTRGLTHLNVSLLVITQRPFLIPKTVRSQMGELYVFRLEERDDADAATERFPDPRKSSAEVQALPQRRFIFKRPTLSTSADTQPSQPPVEKPCPQRTN